MNGPSSMYKMRPIIKMAEEIQFPKCMYKMKVIQNSHYVMQKERYVKDELTSVISEQKPMPEVIALENRQEAILEQLAQLKHQLNNLREQLKQAPVCATPMKLNESLSQNGLSEEIVVKANPKRPPYSLLALNHLLQNKINIISCVHSSIGDIDNDLKIFNKTCSSPLFNIRLIWKDVCDTEFVISPTKHTAIAAEVNLLRFLSRMGPLEFNYEEFGDLCATVWADEILDKCYMLTRETTAKARLVHLKAFGAVLQKQQFLTGDSVSMVDIAGWSTLKQLGFMSKDLPAAINKWFERCNQIFEINILL